MENDCDFVVLGSNGKEYFGNKLGTEARNLFLIFDAVSKMGCHADEVSNLHLASHEIQVPSSR